MIFYIQLNKDGYITDCVENMHNDYTVVNLELPLPSGFISGIYKYLGDNRFEIDEIKLKIEES